jgi:formylglycine-generating enzyme required for sulfatase activity
MTRLGIIVSAISIAVLPSLSQIDAVPVKPDINAEGRLLATMKFVKISKGTFWMGGDSQQPPRKQVEIKEDFELAAYLVTQEQWRSVMGGNPSYFSRTGGGKDRIKDIPEEDLKHFPVEQISWDDVQDFLQQVNKWQTGKGWLYRLPTEAEWEYACRGAVTTKEECSFDFYLEKPTNDLSSTQANFNGAHPAGNGQKGVALFRPTKVGSYPGNRLGLHDMHGNVYQWCVDYWDDKKSRRVVRGGSWSLSAYDCRAAERRWCGATLPDFIQGFLGIRLARSPSARNP